MGLDIRFVLGLMFLVIGCLLAGFGWLGDQSIYKRSLDFNVNLWWGLVIMVFGASLLWLSRRHTSAMRPSEQSKEGRAIEAREHSAGLESDDMH